MDTTGPNPAARSHPLAATGRESPSSRRAALNTTRVLAGCAVLELAAWAAAWMHDWEPVALVVAVGVSMGVAAVMVLRRRRLPG